MKSSTLRNLVLSGLLSASAVQADTVDGLLADYGEQGAGSFDASKGKELWQRKFPSADGPKRGCTSCHRTDSRQGGHHIVTDKAIDPMAPSVNPKRLTERRQVEKWFKRNCKWTLGRECTPQEKGDLLSFLRNQ